ncbi:MAG: hypothetical protein LIP12_00810 [Clostridiales bacterium]|nr:hypothetical protein [Clostridiales bacterium]
MAKKKMTPEQIRARRDELKILFDVNDHDDDKVLDIISDENGEFEESDYWILRLILADYQINYRSPPQDGNY